MPGRNVAEQVLSSMPDPVRPGNLLESGQLRPRETNVVMLGGSGLKQGTK